MDMQKLEEKNVPHCPPEYGRHKHGSLSCAFLKVYLLRNGITALFAPCTEPQVFTGGERGCSAHRFCVWNGISRDAIASGTTSGIVQLFHPRLLMPNCWFSRVASLSVMQRFPKVCSPTLMVQMRRAQVRTETLHLSKFRDAGSCAVHSEEMYVKILCKSNNFE